jgi:hypothetical protein
MLQTLMQYQNMTVRVNFSVDAPNELNRTVTNRRLIMELSIKRGIEKA